MLQTTKKVACARIQKAYCTCFPNRDCSFSLPSAWTLCLLDEFLLRIQYAYLFGDLFDALCIGIMPVGGTIDVMIVVGDIYLKIFRSFLVLLLQPFFVQGSGIYPT